MVLKINGREVTVPVSVVNVEQLLAYLGLSDKVVVVEKNDIILEKTMHQDTTVFDGDQIEIVTFVGGG